MKEDNMKQKLLIVLFICAMLLAAFSGITAGKPERVLIADETFISTTAKGLKIETSNDSIAAMINSRYSKRLAEYTWKKHTDKRRGEQYAVCTFTFPIEKSEDIIEFIRQLGTK